MKIVLAACLLAGCAAQMEYAASYEGFSSRTGTAAKKETAPGQTGVLVDVTSEGFPTPDVLVLALDANDEHQATTDQRGQAFLALAPGPHELMVDSADVQVDVEDGVTTRYAVALYYECELIEIRTPIAPIDTSSTTQGLTAEETADLRRAHW